MLPHGHHDPCPDGLDTLDGLEPRRSLRLVEAGDELDLHLAKVGHDLLAPLAIIVGHLELLESAPTEELRMRSVAAAQRAAARMEQTVFERIHRARQADRMRYADLGVLAARTQDLLTPVADERGVAIEVDDQGTTVGALCRPIDVERVLVNLVDNAVRCSYLHGCVSIRLRTVVDEGRSWAEITVADNGDGMDAHLVEQVLSAFVSVPDASRNGGNVFGEHHGSGLGLAVCADVAREHGGTFTVDSVPGVGSSFVIRLPAAETPSA